MTLKTEQRTADQPPAGQTPGMVGVCWWIVVAMVVAYALWLRAPHMGESFWLDELHSTWVIQGDWSDVARRCRIGNQALLYFGGLKAWARLGESEVLLRTPSLLAGLGLIALLMWQVRRVTGSVAAGIVVGLFAATDRRFIFYATEVRPYAWVQLLAAAHAILTLQIATTTGPSKYVRVAWIACAAAMFHLHYTTAMFLAAELCWLAVYLISRPTSKKSLTARLIDIGLVGMLATPSLWHIAEIAGRRQLWELIARSSNPAQILTLLDAHWYVGGPLCLASVVLVLCYLWRLYKPPLGASSSWSSPSHQLGGGAGDSLTTSLLWLLITLLPVALAWFATAAKLAPVFMSRYVIAAAIGPIMLAGHITAATRGRGRSLVAAGALIIIVAASPSVERFFVWGEAIHDRREDWRGAVAWASKQAASDDSVVLVRSALLEESLLESSIEPLDQDYLLFPILGTYQLADVDRASCYSLSANLSPISEAALAAAVEKESCVAVIRGRKQGATAIVTNLTRQLRRAGMIVRSESGPDFGHVHVFTLRSNPATAQAIATEPQK